MSLWEIIGTVLGVIGVGLMIRQHIWGWPVGLVQVAVYAWVFLEAKLYSDAILQVLFFALQAYGWWHWRKGNGARAPSPASDLRDAKNGSSGGLALPVTRLGAAAVAGWIAAGAVLTAGWGTFMHRTTDAALPYWDAFILVFSLIAQWLQARKNIENWIGWLIVNTVAIGVYWAKDLRLTSGLYVIFWLMAVWGWREWARAIPVGALLSAKGLATADAPKRPTEGR
jgi:nicotinamide mononucleotide transporter